MLKRLIEAPTPDEDGRRISPVPAVWSHRVTSIGSATFWARKALEDGIDADAIDPVASVLVQDAVIKVGEGAGRSRHQKDHRHTVGTQKAHGHLSSRRYVKQDAQLIENENVSQASPCNGRVGGKPQWLDLHTVRSPAGAGQKQWHNGHNELQDDQEERSAVSDVCFIARSLGESAFSPPPRSPPPHASARGRTDGHNCAGFDQADQRAQTHHIHGQTEKKDVSKLQPAGHTVGPESSWADAYALSPRAHYGRLLDPPWLHLKDDNHDDDTRHDEAEHEGTYVYESVPETLGFESPAVPKIDHKLGAVTTEGWVYRDKDNTWRLHTLTFDAVARVLLLYDPTQPSSKAVTMVELFKSRVEYVGRKYTEIDREQVTIHATRIKTRKEKTWFVGWTDKGYAKAWLRVLRSASLHLLYYPPPTSCAEPLKQPTDSTVQEHETNQEPEKEEQAEEEGEEEGDGEDDEAWHTDVEVKWDGKQVGVVPVVVQRCRLNARSLHSAFHLPPSFSVQIVTAMRLLLRKFRWHKARAVRRRQRALDLITACVAHRRTANYLKPLDMANLTQVHERLSEQLLQLSWSGDHGHVCRQTSLEHKANTGFRKELLALSDLLQDYVHGLLPGEAVGARIRGLSARLTVYAASKAEGADGEVDHVRLLENIFRELHVLQCINGWKVPILVTGRMADAAATVMTARGRAYIDQGHLEEGQRCFERVDTIRKQELQMVTVHGTTEIVIAELHIAWAQLLQNQRIFSSIRTFFDAAAHIRDLQAADSSGRRQRLVDVWRLWRQLVKSAKQWRQLALRLRCLRALCDMYIAEGFTHRRPLAVRFARWAWIVRCRNRVARLTRAAEELWVKQRLMRAVRELQASARFGVCMRNVRAGNLRHCQKRTLAEWKGAWRASTERRAVAGKLAVESVETCVALALKFAKKRIMADRAAEKIAKLQYRAAVTIQRHVRGYLVRLAYWRDEMDMQMSFGETVEFDCMVRQWNDTGVAKWCNVRAETVTGRWHDTRLGPAFRCVVQVHERQPAEHLPPPPSMASAQQHNEVVAAPGVLDVMAPAPAMEALALRSIKSHTQVFSVSYQTVMQLLLQRGSTAFARPMELKELLQALFSTCVFQRDPFDMFMAKPEAYDMDQYVRMFVWGKQEHLQDAATATEVAARAMAKRVVEAGMLTCTMRLLLAAVYKGGRKSAAVLSHSLATPYHTVTEMMRANLRSTTTCEALERAVIAAPGLHDMVRLPRWCVQQVEALEAVVLQTMEDVKGVIRRARVTFAHVESAASQAYREAMESLRESCAACDGLKGRKKALVGPGARYRIHTYEQAVMQRKAEAHELIRGANEAGRRVRRLHAFLDTEMALIEKHERTLRMLAACRRSLAEGVVGPVVEQLAGLLNPRCDALERLKVVAMRFAAGKRVLKVKRLAPAMLAGEDSMEEVMMLFEKGYGDFHRYCLACANALAQELTYLHARMFRVCDVHSEDICHNFVRQLQRRAVENKISYVCQRKHQDYLGVVRHEQVLKEIAEDALKPRLRKVTTDYAAKLKQATSRERVTADTHWEVIYDSCKRAIEYCIETKSMIDEYRQPVEIDDEDDMNPLLFKAYGKTDGSENVELTRLRRLHEQLASDLTFLHESIEKRDYISAASAHYGIYGRTWTVERVAQKAAPKAAHQYVKLRACLSDAVYQRYIFIKRIEENLKCTVILPPLPDANYRALKPARARMTKEQETRLHPVLPWKRKKLKRAAAVIQAAWLRVLRRRRLYLRRIVKTQAVVRRRLAYRHLNAIRIQRWWRERYILRQKETRAMLRALTEKKVRREALRLHLSWTKRKDPIRPGQWRWVNDATRETLRQKPRAFGEGDRAFDAPTPRTKRRIQRVCATGPCVWYPVKFAKEYGVYGGRAWMDEVEAGAVLTRAARAMLERRKALSIRSLTILVKAHAEQQVVTTAAVRDIMAAKRREHVLRNLAVKKLQQWWRTCRARREMIKEGLLIKVYRDNIRVQKDTRWARRTLRLVKKL